MKNSTDSHWLHQVAQWLDDTSDQASNRLIADAIGAASESELEVLADLIASKLDNHTPLGRIRYLYQQLASRLVADAQRRKQALPTYIVPPDTIARTYDQIGESDALASSHCLQCLAAQADEESLDTLADLLINNPPAQWQQVGLAISPLWKISGPALGHFFTKLGDAPVQPSTLAVLLDLANHAVRSQRVEEHPWCNRHAEFDSLLKQVVVRLEKLQREPSYFGTTVEAVQQVLADSVALTISLCDTLGQMGNQSSIPALEEAMQLSHRRVQAEAAAALARLGSEQGVNRLVELAADPATRARVVKYAEELDLTAAIDEQYQSPQALAESELSAWLAQPERFGIAPIRIEHLETRTLYWPGYEEPRDTYLFQFFYQLPQGAYSNIGIVGPLTHAFAADLTVLNRDDQFAAFAGWHVEHEEIYEVPASQLNSSQLREVQRLAELSVQSDYQIEKPIALTFLLGDTALLANFTQAGQSLIGIVGEKDSFFLSAPHDNSSLLAEVVLSVFRGRMLLAAFN
jgi:HEAT repeats